MRHDDSCGGGASIIMAFLLGGITGAGLAMLFSPYTGEDNRQKLNDIKDDLYDRKEDIASDARDHIVSAVDKGKEFIAEHKGVINSAIEAGKGAYKKEKDKLTESDA